MRSSVELLVFGVLVAAAACGDDRSVACQESALSYETFGEPFSINWCRGCHSADARMRYMAPVGVNFDTLSQIRAHAPEIRIRAGATTMMPPAGGPSLEERALLVEWLDCGAP